MLNDEVIIENLKQLNFYKNNNMYFIGTINKSGWKTLVECLNYTVALFSKETFVVINEFDDNIAFVPIEFDKNGEPTFIKDKAVLIKQNEITNVEFKVAFLAKKLVINTNKGKKISFIVEEKNRKVLKHEENLKKFISKHS